MPGRRLLADVQELERTATQKEADVVKLQGEREAAATYKASLAEEIERAREQQREYASSQRRRAL